MMKMTKELTMNINRFTINGFKEFGVKYAKELGFTPMFKTFRFDIYSGYEWGKGYTADGQKCFFENVVCPAVIKEMDWAFNKGRHSGDCPTGAKYNEGYMYMHPMEITGYIKPELMSKLVNCFATFGQGKVKVSSDVTWYFDVFDMEDREVAKYYYLHKNFFKNELKELMVNNDYLRSNIADILPIFYDKEKKEFRNERIGTMAGYNDNFLYRLFHIISKKEDECTTHSEATDFFWDVMDVIINELFKEKTLKSVDKKPDSRYKRLKYTVA